MQDHFPAPLKESLTELAAEHEIQALAMDEAAKTYPHRAPELRSQAEHYRRVAAAARRLARGSGLHRG